MTTEPCKRREQLRELVRTEPTIAETFADLSAEREEVLDHLATLQVKHRELRTKLAAIADAKQELAELAAIESEGEPADGEPQGDQSETQTGGGEEDASGGRSESEADS